MKQSFNITGMSCSACSAHVEKSVSKLLGVRQVSVNLLAASMKVDYDESSLTADAICQAVIAAGYGAQVEEEKSPAKAAKDSSVFAGSSPMEKEIKNMKFRLIVSFAFLIPLMYIAMGSMMGLPVPSIFIGEENGKSKLGTESK